MAFTIKNWLATYTSGPTSSDKPQSHINCTVNDGEGGDQSMQIRFFDLPGDQLPERVLQGGWYYLSYTTQELPVILNLLKSGPAVMHWNENSASLGNSGSQSTGN